MTNGIGSRIVELTFICLCGSNPGLFDEERSNEGNTGQDYSCKGSSGSRRLI